MFLRFGDDFWVILGAIIVKKIDKKSVKKLTEFLRSKLEAGSSTWEAGKAVQGGGCLSSIPGSSQPDAVHRPAGP